MNRIRPPVFSGVTWSRACAATVAAFLCAIAAEPVAWSQRATTFTPKAKQHWQEGQTAEDKGELDRAVRAYSAAIELQADYVEAYIGRGRAHLFRDDPGQAVVDLTRALELDKQSVWAFNYRALALARQSKIQEAVADLRQALALDPENAEVRRNLDRLLKPVDMRTWKQQGPQANGDWELAKDGTSVLQKINGAPTFFVNPDNLLNTTIQGKFRVEDHSDDDYIGFVFGYQAPFGEVQQGPVPCDFFLFAWKRGPQQEAPAGFTLVRVRGPVVVEDSADSPWWKQVGTPQYQVLARKHGDDKGWEHDTDYLFDLVYERDRIRIAVDGKSIFDVPNPRGDNPAGRFGFYNYSQAGVRYSGFTIRPALPDPLATVRVVYEGKDGAVLPPKLLPAVELIFDCSLSMKEPVSGTPKIDIARRVLRELTQNLPADMQVGLRLYGHLGFWHSAKDPKPPYPTNDDPRLKTDSNLVVQIGPFGTAKRKNLLVWLDWAEPEGKTPLCYSLLEARKDFPAACAGKTVVLLSDGMETCGGSLDDVARAYANSDIGVVIQVVGFDIREPKVRQQLEKIAKLGGGKYYDARDARQLVDALRQAIPSTGFEVLAADRDTVVASALVNGKPLELAAGSYRVRLAGSKAEPTAVRLVRGQLMQLKLDEAGQLQGQARP
jgi:hypothetical protein